MTAGLKTIIYPVTDLPRAKALYGALLDVTPYMDAPYYVAFSAGGQDVGLDPNGHAQGVTGPIAYWHVDGIRKRVQLLRDAGARIQQEIKDVGGGKLVASLHDADGDVIGLIQSP
jgi:predicted enzyme related to lactoylglutathione lyase